MTDRRDARTDDAAGCRRGRRRRRGPWSWTSSVRPFLARAAWILSHPPHVERASHRRRGASTLALDVHLARRRTRTRSSSNRIKPQIDSHLICLKDP